MITVPIPRVSTALLLSRRRVTAAAIYLFVFEILFIYYLLIVAISSISVILGP